MNLEGAKAVKTPGEDTPAWKLDEEEEPHRPLTGDKFQGGGSSCKLLGIGSNRYPVCRERVLQRNGKPSKETLEFAKQISKIPLRRAESHLEV